MLLSTEFMAWVFIIFIDMYAEMNPEKTSTSRPRISSMQIIDVLILGKT